MVSLFKRFQYTLEADLHALFDKKEDKNPLNMLNQYIREAEKQTGDTKQLLKRQSLLKQQLEKELEEASTMLAKRTNQLELAKESGEEILILFTTQEVESYKSRQWTLQESVLEANNELIQLEQKYEKMKHQLKDMKVRQLQLMGKENVTRAHHKMDSIMDANNKTNYHDLSHYIDHLATNNNAAFEVNQIEERLAQLERQKQATTTQPVIETKEDSSN